VNPKKTRKFGLLAGACLLLRFAAHAQTNVTVLPPGSDRQHALIFDEPSQNFTAKPNDAAARFIFKFKNTSTNEFVINDIKTSCDCTLAAMPQRPWRLAPGETNSIGAVVDLRDHMKGVTSSDVLFKQIFILSGAATDMVTIMITIPAGLTNTLPPHDLDRLWWQQLGLMDHQELFKINQCAQCHLVPAFGKNGENLYHVACGICHDASPRAPMVPDLRTLKTPISSNYWQDWISVGKPGTLMPGFLNSEGGPLEQAQVDLLVKYMTNAFPRPTIPAQTNSTPRPANK
jgi:Protein of unknown function (DUF1573)